MLSKVLMAINIYPSGIFSKPPIGIFVLVTHLPSTLDRGEILKKIFLFNALHEVRHHKRKCDSGDAL